MKYTRRPWTHDERITLSKQYYSSDCERLKQLFPDRSYNSCVKQAKYLRDRGWVFTKKSKE